jgi:hypothetical protein
MSFINELTQSFDIVLADGEASKTYTLPMAVNVNRYTLMHHGVTSPSSTVRIKLTDASTVTAYKSTGAGTANTVSGAIRS